MEMELTVADLKGAGLLLILANWPPENNNPEKFWRSRSLENGIYIIACNRTGKDKTMNCQKAESFIIDLIGAVVERISSPEDIIICSTLSKDAFRLSEDIPDHTTEMLSNKAGEKNIFIVYIGRSILLPWTRDGPAKGTAGFAL